MEVTLKFLKEFQEEMIMLLVIVPLNYLELDEIIMNQVNIHEVVFFYHSLL